MLNNNRIDAHGLVPDASKCPELTVVIPTFNRRDVLQKTLRLLDRQDWRDFEVVVVDDGSTDGSAAAVEALAPDLFYPIKLIRQTNSGPATARNRGIAAARGRVTLLIGDDTLPASDLVRRHFEHHAENPGAAEAALGYTRWCETHQVVTPYMRWVGENGIQFDYAHLLTGGAPDWRHFYTSNLSLKTDCLRARPFCEDFPAAAVEDIELGYRLHQEAGLRMSFLPDAVVNHVHPMTFRQGCRRQETVGICWRIFDLQRQHEDFKEQLLQGGWHLRLRNYTGVRKALAWLGEQSLALRCPNGFAERVLLLHFRIGYMNRVAMEAAGEARA